VPDASAHAARLPIGSSAATHSTTHTLLVTFFVVIYVTLLVALVMLGDALFTGLWSTALPRLAFALASAAPLALLWPMLRSRRVVVGADGVRIDGLVRRRYYPLDSIRGMTARPDGGVSLDLQTGRTVEIPGRPDGGGLASRIADAMRARGEARDRGEVEVHGLARDGRKVTRWRDELKRLAADASYRAEAVRVADLETVLTNPIADPEQRVAAAVALSQDDGARKRIRIAAEASADPDLKAALEAAAEGELATSRIRKARKRHSGG
jgi:hypothetical protein